MLESKGASLKYSSTSFMVEKNVKQTLNQMYSVHNCFLYTAGFLDIFVLLHNLLQVIKTFGVISRITPNIIELKYRK